MDDVSNSIVLANIIPPPDQYIRDYQSRGALAVVFLTTSYIPGGSISYTDNGDTRDLVVPAMDMLYADFANISGIISENFNAGEAVYGVLEYGTVCLVNL
jgi:hypothetical protein